eukprot:TRINITY_DN47_c9_g1_i3.p1 TRINITY_DN47_c9_g1~~TRINITY_DN47_c9_g1_i3.p1  ORF type:complete len:578 (+),score=161.71 TRINITY_DN47_c9_g1_i3:84-1817(+)
MSEVGGKKGGKGTTKPTLPSAEPMKQKVAKLKEEIDRNNERIKQIKLVVDERRMSGRGRSESQELLTKLGIIRGQITQCLNQKNAIREQIEVQERTKKATKSQVVAAKEKMKMTSINEIDKQIKIILDKLNNDDTEEAEQEILVSRIKQLSQSKEVLNNAKEKIQQLEQASAKSSDYSKQLDEINERMEDLVKEEKETRKKAQKVQQAEKEEVADIPALNEEKQACYEVIVECRATIKQLQEDYNQEFEEYKNKLEEFRNEQDKAREEQQKARQEREESRRAEDKEKQIARKQRQIEIAGAPFSEEILRCDQLIAFLAKFDAPKTELGAASATAAAADVASSTAVPNEQFGQMKMIKKKNLREEDEENDPLSGMLSRTAAKKKKGKKNKVVAPEPKKLNLDMDLLMAFSQIKVTVPATPEEVPSILQEVRTKKTQYQEKQKKAIDAITRGERYVDTDDVPAADKVTATSNDLEQPTENADEKFTEAETKVEDKNIIQKSNDDEDDENEEEEAINESAYETSEKFQKKEPVEDDDKQEDDGDKDNDDINNSKFLQNVKTSVDSNEKVEEEEGFYEVFF